MAVEEMGESGMSRLNELRNRLMKLHRQRRNARLGTAWAAVAIAVCCALAALFVVDWTMEMTRLQRVIAMLMAVGVVYWAYRRYAAPLLQEGESLMDVALLVERQQHIDSDLVAALQFETTEAQQWGSADLEKAVVDYVADFSSGLDVFEGFNREQMARRGFIAAITVFLLLAFTAIFPMHAIIFVNRMMMSAAHYPTNTIISKVWINGQEVTLTPGMEETVQSPYGLPLTIELEATGEIPKSALASLWTEGGLNTEIVLEKQSLAASQKKKIAADKNSSGDRSSKPETSDAARKNSTSSNLPARLVSMEEEETAESSDTTTFQGKLPRLVDSLQYQLYVGDAWTEPALVKVIPLPKVEFTLKPTPPKYARQAEDAAVASSARQFAVVEGSRVDLEVISDKPLKEATLFIEEEEFPLEHVDQTTADKLDHWQLKTDGTPLESVSGPLAYRIEAEDEDGLKPSQPIQGFIRLRSDKGPRVYGTIGTRTIVPSAKQPITYHASDDFGVNAIRLQVQVQRKNSMEMNEEDSERLLVIRPPGKPELRVDGSYTLDLSSFGLEKGDQVTVTLEAEDYRGGTEGRTSQGEPLTMYVTDQSGVLADTTELDEQAARQFESIIKLGIGDKP